MTGRPAAAFVLAVSCAALGGCLGAVTPGAGGPGSALAPASEPLEAVPSDTEAADAGFSPPATELAAGGEGPPSTSD